MSHEFEDQQDSLGELPEDISGPLERDEFDSFHKKGDTIQGRGIPPDIQAEHAIRSVAGEAGSPGIPASVTTVYDARPINARDFLHQEVQAISIDDTGI